MFNPSLDVFRCHRLGDVDYFCDKELASRQPLEGEKGTKWEKGERLDFNISQINAVAKALNCTTEYLMYGSKISTGLNRTLSDGESRATSSSTSEHFDRIDAKIYRIIESLETLSVRLSSLESRMAKLEMRV